jgi:hypothetical protein
MDSASFITLGKFVDNFCAQSYNDGQRAYDNILVIAQHFYGEIKRKHLKTYRKRKLSVEQGLNIVYLPGDVHRIIKVKVTDDCNHEQELDLDQYYDIDKPEAAKGCGCKKCDCTSSLCGAINSISYEEEDVLVHDDKTYRRIIKSKVQPNGDLIRETVEPYATKGDNGQIIIAYKTHIERVTTVEVKNCGCVIDSPVNRSSCISACGVSVCDQLQCDQETTIPLPHMHHGRYKVDEDKTILHLIGCSPSHVKVQYVSNGSECDEETLVDIDDVEALLNGVYYGTLRFRRDVSPLEKREALRAYERSKQERLEDESPIDPSRLLELQNTFYKW